VNRYIAFIITLPQGNNTQAIGISSLRFKKNAKGACQVLTLHKGIEEVG
jgi:hypothetical protein